MGGAASRLRCFAVRMHLTLCGNTPLALASADDITSWCNSNNNNNSNNINNISNINNVNNNDDDANSVNHNNNISNIKQH